MSLARLHLACRVFARVWVIVYFWLFGLNYYFRIDSTMKHLWIVFFACCFVLGNSESLVWAKPVRSSGAKKSTSNKLTKLSTSSSKRKVSQGDQGGVDGPPPPPASNEIPPPPPPLKTKRKKRRSKKARNWEERYSERAYRRRKRRRRRVRRRRRTRLRYRRFRRKRFLRKRNRARFWWSMETGLTAFWYHPPSSNNLPAYEYVGVSTVGQIGFAYRSFMMSVGVGMSTSVLDDEGDDDVLNVGGFVGQLSVSMGFFLSKFILVEGGISMTYLGLDIRGVEDSALLFPAHVGATFRIPIGRRKRSSIGLRTLFSFAHDPDTESAFYSLTLNLVYQTW